MTSSQKDSIQLGTFLQLNSTYPKIFKKKKKNTKRQNLKDCIILQKKHHSLAISKNNSQPIRENPIVEPNYTIVNFKPEMSLREMHSQLKELEN